MSNYDNEAQKVISKINMKINLVEKLSAKFHWLTLL